MTDVSEIKTETDLEQAKPLPKIKLEKSAVIKIVVETAEKLDRPVNILTSFCCTFPPVKEKNMRERIKKIQKLFSNPESVDEKTIDKAIGMMEEVVKDSYDMVMQFGGQSPQIHSAVKAGMNNLVRLKRYF